MVLTMKKTHHAVSADQMVPRLSTDLSLSLAKLATFLKI